MDLKKVKAGLLTIAASLGLAEKVKTGQLSTEDFDKMDEQFKAEHGMSFMEAIEKAKKDSKSQKELEAIKALFGDNIDTQNGDDNQGSGQQNVDVVARITELQEQIKLLSTQQDTQKPQIVKLDTKKVVAFVHTATHAFGVENDMYSVSKPWNANTIQNSNRTDSYSRQEYETLMADFDNFNQLVGKRWNMLHKSNQLGKLEGLMAAGDIDYTDLETAFGAEYMVRRIDTIITYIRKLESISSIFPVRSNVQDKETVTHSFMGKSFTQAYQAGEVFAGNAKFQPDAYQVSKVMFKFKFHDLKDLENEYIGYLNREGSDPMKWAFIEWIMVQNAIIAHNERELRRISGVRVEPTAEKAAYFMYASNGIITAMLNKVDEFAARQFTDLVDYNSTTIVEYVRSLVRKTFIINSGNLQGWTLVMNSMFLPDFLEGYREKYKSDSNFAGEKVEVKDFPLPKIVGVNMGESKLMFMMKDDAIELLENKPGEFFSFYFERRLEQLFACSYGAEGVYVNAGRKFASAAALIASKGKQTNIFLNNPVTELAADATTADATVNNMFQTIANAAATAFTDFVGAVEGVAYRLVCGNVTNATTITKAVKFSGITDTFTPTAVGDYLEVIYDPTTSKYIELKRKVGGTLAVNAAAKAPEYVEQN